MPTPEELQIGEFVVHTDSYLFGRLSRVLLTENEFTTCIMMYGTRQEWYKVTTNSILRIQSDRILRCGECWCEYVHCFHPRNACKLGTLESVMGV